MIEFRMSRSLFSCHPPHFILLLFLPSTPFSKHLPSMIFVRSPDISPSGLLRFTQLLLSEEDAACQLIALEDQDLNVQVSDHNDDLAHQTKPELPVRERVVSPRRNVPDGEIREHVAWAKLRRRRRSSDHDDNRTEKLGTGKGRADMETRKRLEQNHTETNTLDGIEHTQPQPDTGRAEVSMGSVPSTTQTSEGAEWYETHM